MPHTCPYTAYALFSAFYSGFLGIYFAFLAYKAASFFLGELFDAFLYQPGQECILLIFWVVSTQSLHIYLHHFRIFGCFWITFGIS